MLKFDELGDVGDVGEDDVLAMFNCKKEEGSNYRGGGDRFQEPESLDA